MENKEAMSKRSLRIMRNLENCSVMALMDVPYLVSHCKLQGLILDKATKMQLISHIFNGIGHYYGYKVIEDMMKNGLNNWDGEDFEVEKILDHVTEKGEDFFLIKWKGWSSDYNSWEMRDNLSNCDELLDSFQNSKEKSDDVIVPETRQAKIEKLHDYLKERYHDSLLDDILTVVKESKMLMKLLRTRRNRIPAHHKFSKLSKLYKVHRTELLKSFASWEEEMNSDPKFAPICVENNVDMEGPPTDFVYISSHFHSGAVAVDNKPGTGCKCSGGDCFGHKKRCCGQKAGYEFAYTKFKRLRINVGEAIYECNKRCSCDESCPNRVVQLGRKVPLCLFRTSNGRGWGVKAARAIKKGTFVEEYVGEVITSEEAERRGQTYDAEGLTYLFDLDFHERDCAFTIDAKTYGNISHFINHSCDPNLGVFNVWIDNHDERFPRIALFAMRDIKEREELTFDYKMDMSDDSLNASGADESKSKDIELEDATSSCKPTIPDYRDQTPSESSKSSATNKENSSSAALKSGAEQLSKELKIILNRGLTDATNLNAIFPTTNTPSESSISNLEMLSPENLAQSESQQHYHEGMRLRPRKSKRLTEEVDLKTKSWVSSCGMFIHDGRPQKFTRRKDYLSGYPDRRGGVPPLKRMRIPCNCGAASCRKWLC